MGHRLTLATAIGVLMAIAACSTPIKVTPLAVTSGKAGVATATAAPALTAPIAAAARILTVLVQVPKAAGIVTNGGGNLIGNNGANYRLSALEEVAVAGAEVYLADAQGRPLPGAVVVRTDAQGQAVIQNPPADRTVVVAARVTSTAGKEARLMTLAHATQPKTTASVDLASTLVSLGTVRDVSGDVGKVDIDAFESATAAADQVLKADRLPDLTDTAALLAEIDRLTAEVADLKKALEAVKQAIAGVDDAIDKEIEKTDVPMPSMDPSVFAVPSPLLSGIPGL